MDGQNFYSPFDQENLMPYGMRNDVPQPMGMVGGNTQGFPNVGSSYSNNPFVGNYAKGGRVSLNSLRKAVEAIREQGSGQDKILAHINPQEAYELAQMHGGDINPISGLPQFGKFEEEQERVYQQMRNQRRNQWPYNVPGMASNKEMDENARNMARATTAMSLSNAGPMTWDERLMSPVLDAADNFMPFLLRTAGTAMGSLVGGPFGGMALGTAMGGATDPEGRVGRGLGQGALHSGLQVLGGPVLGKAAGLPAASGLGRALGMNGPGLLSSLGKLGGLGGAKATTGSAGRAAAIKALSKTGAAQMAPAAAKTATGGGFLSSLLGGKAAETAGESGKGGLLSGILGGNMLDKALLGTAVIGSLLNKNEVPKEPSMQEIISQGPRWSPDQQPRRIPQSDRALRYFDPNNYTPGFTPEQTYFTNVNPTFGYAKGGHVFSGNGDGQADNIEAELPEGGYVIDASTVSDLGDGNSEAGAHRLSATLGSLSSHKYKKGGKSRGTVPAHVSASEFYVDPETVDALGKGNNDKGADKLKKMVDRVRKQKRSSSKGLPPKAKSIKSYLGGK